MMSRRQQLETMLESEPDDVFLHYALACEMMKEGDTPAGFRRFDAIHERFPDYVPAWFRHAQLLAEHGDGTRAKEIGERGLACARRVGDVHAAGEIAEFLAML